MRPLLRLYGSRAVAKKHVAPNLAIRTFSPSTEYSHGILTEQASRTAPMECIVFPAWGTIFRIGHLNLIVNRNAIDEDPPLDD